MGTRDRLGSFLKVLRTRTQTNKHTHTHKSPVRRPSWQNLSALLRVSHTVYGLLWILTFCYGGDLEQTNKPLNQTEMHKTNQHHVLYIVKTRTERVCLCVRVFYLYSLDLWGLDNRWLCSLDDTVDLNRLSVGKLHQRYRGTCCWGVACCHGYLKFRNDVTVLSAKSTLTWKIFQTIYGIQNWYFFL